MMPRLVSFVSTLFILLVALFRPAAAQHELQPSQLLPEAMAVIFSGQERMLYEVSWSGGLKIGEIHLDISPATERPDAYAITAKVISSGTLHLFYPVDDVFHCIVAGDLKLPLRYEVFQREGHSDTLTKRASLYAQTNHLVRYQKNDGPLQIFAMGGMAYNEIAAFIITRALRLQADEPVIVPTFADGKRHEVKVQLHKKESRTTIFGKRQTLKVQPLLRFKGVYDKSGSTLLWLTDDQCRVPVEIRSQIALGSLVARLVRYDNPACTALRKTEPSKR